MPQQFRVTPTREITDFHDEKLGHVYCCFVFSIVSVDWQPGEKHIALVAYTRMRAMGLLRVESIAQHRDCLSELAVALVSAHIRANGGEPGTETSIVPTSDEIQRALFQWERVCEFQARGRAGLVCDAKTSDDIFKGATTSEICGRCNLPDQRIRCSHLVHPAVKGARPDPSAPMNRWVTNALCERGCAEVSKPHLCRAGGHECWELVVTRPLFVDGIPEGIESRVCDEVDHFNLAWQAIFKSRLFATTSFRSIEELTKPCDGRDDLIRKIQCLGDILANLTVPALEADKSVEPHDRIKGSVNRLMKLFEEQEFPPNNSAFHALRAITQLRNGFPAHTGTRDFGAACHALGLGVVFEDFGRVWIRVLRAFVGAVQDLRRSLPA